MKKIHILSQRSYFILSTRTFGKAKNLIRFSFSFMLLALILHAQSVSATTYYSAASNAPNTLANWWTGTNGTGSHPANFTSTSDVFIVQNTHTMTTSADWAVSGRVQINSGGTLVLSAFNVTISGGTTVTGTLNITSSNGTKIFAGLLTINSGGKWNNSINSPVTFRGGITNNGTFTAGSAYTYTFDTNDQALTGTINMSTAAITVTGITLTNNGTLTIAANFSGTGTLINASTGTLNTTAGITISNLTNQGILNATSNNLTPSTLTNTGTLNISGTAYTAPTTLTNSGTITYSSSGNLNTPFSNTGKVNINSSGYVAGITNSTGGTLNISALSYNINTLTATDTDNTVNYNGTGAQTIKNVTYQNLTLSGSGTKTFTVATTITNVLAIANGVVANLGTNNHTAGYLYLDNTGRVSGSWGSTSSTATNKNNVYFSATSGKLNVSNTSLEFWYKADLGVTGTTSVTAWSDQSGNTNDASNTGTVSLADNSINFNPSLSFTAVNCQFLTAKSTQPIRFLVVTKPSSSSADLAGLIGAGSGSVTDKGIRMGDGSSTTSNPGGSWKGDNNTDDWFFGGGTSSINGVTSFVHNYTWHIVNQSRASVLGSSQYYLGGYIDAWDGPRSYTGNIAEVIATNTNSAPSNNILESYLAIKYGITLGSTASPVNYVNPSGTIIWTGNSTYQNDVTGLGRNSTYGLNQKASSSINLSSGAGRVIMATTNNFALSNLDASRTSLSDGQYLIWGHNNGVIGTLSAIAGTRYKKTARVWQVQNTNNVDSVYFQVDLTGIEALPSPSTGYYYAILVSNSSAITSSTITNVYKLTNSGGNIYTGKPKFPSGINYYTIVEVVPNYWKGTTSSTNWGTASNWTANAIPLSGEDVIYATVTNYGTDALNDLVLDQDRTVGNLTNATTKQLIIPAGKALTVNGTLTSGSDPNLIQIQANSTSPNGSLIFTKPSLNTNVQATVQMYARGCKTSTPAVWTAPNGQTFTTNYLWQYFGSPVQSAKASPTFDGSWVRKYYETANLSSYYNKWIQYQNDSVLTPFTGYELTQNATKTVSIQGALVVNDVVLNLTATTGTGLNYGSGYNIFGNSYTAAIDIQKMVFGSGVEQTVYLYNTGSLDQWGNSSLTAGTYTTITPGTSPVTGREIPSMQGFLLKTTNNTTVTIPYNATTNSLTKNTNSQRVKEQVTGNTKLNSNNDLSYMKIEVNSDNNYDYTWIFDKENTSHAFDNGWDGYKLPYMKPMYIYSDETAGNMQINVLNDIDSVYLSFKAGNDAQYTLTINSVNLLDKYNDLYLTDLTTGTFKKIDANTVTYVFNANNTTQAEKRFLISGSKKTVKEEDAHPFIISSNQGKLQVANNGTESGQLYVYDTIGKLITAGYNCPAGTSTIIPVRFQNGVYITKMITEKKKEYKQKIILR